MASAVEIVNMALSNLGADTIMSLTEDTENARRANTIYDRTRLWMMFRHPWNFTIKEVALSLLSETPVIDDYTKIHQLPADCLRVLKTDLTEGYTFKVQGRKVYSDSDTIT